MTPLGTGAGVAQLFTDDALGQGGGEHADVGAQRDLCGLLLSQDLTLSTLDDACGLRLGVVAGLGDDLLGLALGVVTDAGGLSAGLVHEPGGALLGVGLVLLGLVSQVEASWMRRARSSSTA